MQKNHSGCVSVSQQQESDAITGRGATKLDILRGERGGRIFLVCCVILCKLSRFWGVLRFYSGWKEEGEKKSLHFEQAFFSFLKTDRMWNHCLSTLASCVVLPWQCLQRNVKKTVTQLAIIQRQTGNSNCSHIHLTSTSLKYARVWRETSAGALRLESTRRKRLFSYLQPLMWTRSPVSQTSCRLGWGGWRSQHIPRDSSAAVGGKKKKKPHTFHFLLLKDNSVQFGVKQTPSWIYILHQHQVFKDRVFCRKLDIHSKISTQELTLIIVPKRWTPI